MTTAEKTKEVTKEEVELWCDRTFNQVHIDMVEAYAKQEGHEFLGELVQNPSFAIMVQDFFDSNDIDDFFKQYQEDGNIVDPLAGFILSKDKDFIEWLEENHYDEIFEAFDESYHYPMWSTLFEFSSDFDSSWAMDHIDELYEIGIGVIEGFATLNACLFIGGCGYDFYEAHWTPLLKLYRS